MARTLVFAGFLLALASAASAQDRPVIVVVEGDATALPADALREAVSRELGAPALAVGDPQAQDARGTLTVQLVDAAPSPGAAIERRLVVVYRDATGREVWRTIAVPNDPIGAIATIALLAGNLARDEASELIAQLRPPPSIAPAPEPVPEDVPASPPPFPVLAPVPPPPPAPPTVIVVPAPVPEPARTLASPVDGGEPEEDGPDPYEHDWNFTAAIGWTTDLHSEAYARAEVTATYRWGGRLAAGLATTLGGAQTWIEELPGRGLEPEPVTIMRWGLLPVIEHRSTLGVFWLDVGAGLGLMMYSVSTSAFSYSDAIPHARLQGTLAWPFATGADLFARIDFSTTFEEITAGGALEPAYAMFDGTLAAGIRGRL